MSIYEVSSLVIGTGTLVATVALLKVAVQEKVRSDQVNSSMKIEIEKSSS